ncbi:MAG: undecaprenyldiphospho-muramoylpentapeptide beta-N-acetylglucosaminyltransferase [Desulfuromonas sp.]|nr:MAG: undecaprenyldiphospho-muramoylpentapeptide beta-N-acetylglucosaminyltransferase [Desulfuromonas sp.]
MRLLLAGGGTGGHLFPAVALAQQLLAEDPAAETLFVGTKRGIEVKVLPKLNLSLATIDIVGLVDKGALGKLALLPRLIKSITQSIKLLRGFRPDVVVGVGGYAAGPVLFAAWLLRLPTLVHEQNAWPGLTNRLLAPLARRICLSFDEARGAFPTAKTVLTGNPLRLGMEECPPLDPDGMNLLVFGGSRGAKAINEALLAALPHWGTLKGQLRILHQTGEADCAAVRQGYAEAGWGEEVKVLPFIDDMAGAYAQHQLVLCRAGATTIAELTACGRPALLIPYPYAAGDHQTANASAMAQRGAALLLHQSKLDGETLAKLVADLLRDRTRLLDMADAARSLGHLGAAQRILNECRSLLGGQAAVHDAH